MRYKQTIESSTKNPPDSSAFLHSDSNRRRNFRIPVSLYRADFPYSVLSRPIPVLNNRQQTAVSNRTAPERRCSSRTFRYGYLVTT